MRIPGPGDVFRVAGSGYEAIERAIALVPRLVAMVSEVEVILARVNAVVADIETTQKRANSAVEHVETIEHGVDQILDRSRGLVDRTDGVVSSAATLTTRVAPLLDRFEPLLVRLEPVLVKLAPMLDRLAETTSATEVDSVVKVVDALPKIVDKLDSDILPVLDTLATVAPDVRDLLDVSRQLNELIGSLPGLGRMKRKIEENQDRQDDYRAMEEPPAAPDRKT